MPIQESVTHNYFIIMVVCLPSWVLSCGIPRTSQGESWSWAQSVWGWRLTASILARAVADTAEVTSLQWHSDWASGDTFKVSIDRTIFHKLTAFKVLTTWLMIWRWLLIKSLVNTTAGRQAKSIHHYNEYRWTPLRSSCSNTSWRSAVSSSGFSTSSLARREYRMEQPNR